MMNGLMSLETMVKNAKSLSLMQDYNGPNTTASLGIGSNLSYTIESFKNGLVPKNNNSYTWEQLLCPPSDDVNKASSEYNIMNIGGWGNINGGKSPIRWHLSDIPGYSSGTFDQKEIDMICAFMRKHNYAGISLDIEGVCDGWTRLNGNHILNTACGAIKAQGFFVWIVIPGFNVKKEFGGPITIYPKNITLVQLMCYGRGLDSVWGGDPRGNHLSASDLRATISALNKSGVQADQIMLAWSFFDNNQPQTDFFLNMMAKFGKDATAGCFAWCKGNSKTWTWNGKKVNGGNLATCAPACDTITSKDACLSPRCTWGKTYSTGTCQCLAYASKYKCD